MQTVTHKWRWIGVPVTIWIGVELAAAIRLLGYPQLVGLGVAAAAVAVAGTGRGGIRRGSARS